MKNKKRAIIVLISWIIGSGVGWIVAEYIVRAI